MDVGTGLAALGTAQVSKEMLGKMLGPTAEYIGDGVRSWTERRVANAQRVFSTASNRLGPALDQPGTVPPRVLKAILEEAQFADDALTAEYLGGVLASSRTEMGRDDRAAIMGRLISDMSTYALRSHYIFYAAARRHEIGLDPRRWKTGTGAEEKRLFIATNQYVRAMEFSEAEGKNFVAIFSDAMLNLERHGLVTHWSTGTPEHLRRSVLTKDFQDHGIVFQITQAGIALYCAAHGIQTDPFEAFMSTDVRLEMPGGPEVPDGTPVDRLPTYETSTEAPVP